MLNSTNVMRLDQVAVQAEVDHGPAAKELK